MCMHSVSAAPAYGFCVEGAMDSLIVAVRASDGRLTLD